MCRRDLSWQGLDEEGGGVMAYNKRDPFFISGLISPDEYDWRGQFAHIARTYWRGPFSSVSVDVGKLMGLCRELERLRKEREL